MGDSKKGKVMSDCLFCKIAQGETPADKVYENDRIVAFNDINAQAPVHVLIIPKKHIATMNEIEQNETQLYGELLLVAANIAKEKGIDDAGYRVVMNCNQDGGQAVYHIHLHLLGGRPMAWPPG